MDPERNLMARSRNSAKQAGARFEREAADYLAEHVSEFIDRRVKSGAKDLGDISNVRTRHNEKVVVEVKNVMKQALPQWTKEAHQEAENDNALVGVVVHKRHGCGTMGDQWVTCTLDDLVALLTGQRPK